MPWCATMTRNPWAVLGAAFVVALGFGTLVPLMPVYLASFDAQGGFDTSAHTGAVAATFMAAASLAAPGWGFLSDRVTRTRIVAIGLTGTTLAVLPFMLSHGLVSLYISQFLAGVFFSAVLPPAAAWFYETGPVDSRAKRLARLTTAALGGYLTGPAIGGLLSAGAEEGILSAHEVVFAAFLLQAGLAAVAAGFVWAMPVGRRSVHPTAVIDPHSGIRVKETAFALAVVALAAFALGGFEVATALHIRTTLGLPGRAVATLFFTCALAMIVVQLCLLPVLHRASGHRASLWLLLGVGALIAALPLAITFWATILLGALIGGALGLAIGLLGLRVAAMAGAQRGFALGGQSAVSNAAQAVGAATGATLVSLLSYLAFPLLGGAIALAVVSLGMAGAHPARPGQVFQEDLDDR